MNLLALPPVLRALPFLLFAWPVTAREPAKPTEIVGRIAPNRYLTPTNQILTPVGRQVELPGLRPQALALSPDGKILVTAGKTKELVVIEPTSGRVLQVVALPSSRVEPPPTTPVPSPETVAGATNTTREPSSQLSFTGLVFSPDGAHIYLSNVGGSVKFFNVDKAHVVTGVGSLPVPDARTPKRKQEIPTGLAVSPDGERLYVVGNLANTLHELEAATGKLLRSWKTGVAPFDVVLAGTKAYVSNEGGRVPGNDDVSAPAGRGTSVRVDKEHWIANEGSVTVIDLAAGSVKSEVIVELHASAMRLSPNGRYLVVANTGSDTLSVIDTQTDQVVEKIWTRQTPADLFGAQPNALAFDPSGKRLYAANGTQNAVAVIKFDPKDNESKVLGLIPVGWFPGAIECDFARKSLYVANIKGQGAAKILKPGDKPKFGSKDFFGTVSLFPIPADATLPALTQVALRTCATQNSLRRRCRPAPARRPFRCRNGSGSRASSSTCST